MWASRPPSKVVRPAVHGKFALKEAAEAHAAVESRVNRGKVVLHP
ncbi:zinc-binding dehydrogenase [Streptomyces sp. NPDC056464]